MTRWVVPDSERRMRAASAAFFAFPMIRSPSATTVSAARTSVGAAAAGSRVATARALRRAMASAARRGGVPRRTDSSTSGITISIPTPAAASSSRLRGEPEARISRGARADDAAARDLNRPRLRSLSTFSRRGSSRGMGTWGTRDCAHGNNPRRPERAHK